MAFWQFLIGLRNRLSTNVVPPLDDADPPLPPILPKIYGFPGVGQPASCDYGQYVGIITDLTQRWYRFPTNATPDAVATGGTAITAEGSDFAATKCTIPNNAGQYVFCRVTATGLSGTGVVWSLPIGPITAAPTQTTFYVGPVDRGLADGSSAANCKVASYLDTDGKTVHNNFVPAIQQLVADGHGPNGRIYFCAGDYSVLPIGQQCMFGFYTPTGIATFGGDDPTWPVVVEMDPGAIFVGTRTAITYPADPYGIVKIGPLWPGTVDGTDPWFDGNYLFRVGSAHLPTFQNIEFKNWNVSRWNTVFKLQGKTFNMRFTNCEMDNCNNLIDVLETDSKSKSHPVIKLYVRGCTIIGNGTQGIRVQYASRDILIENTTFDGKRTSRFVVGTTLGSQKQWAMGISTKDSPQGIFINGIEGGWYYNDQGSSYWNADVIDCDSDAGAANLTVAHSELHHCTDAGLDCKINNVLCFKVNCHDNKRNYKIWGLRGGYHHLVQCISANPQYGLTTLMGTGGSGRAAHIDAAGGADIGVAGLQVVGGGWLADLTDGGLPFLRLWDVDETAYTGPSAATVNHGITYGPGGQYGGSDGTSPGRYSLSSNVTAKIYEMDDLHPYISQTPAFNNPTLDLTPNVNEGVAYSQVLGSTLDDVKIEHLDGVDLGRVAITGTVADQSRTISIIPQNFESPVHADNQLDWRERILDPWRNEGRYAFTLQVDDVTEIAPAGSVTDTLATKGWRWHNTRKTSYSGSYAWTLSGTENKTVTKGATNADAIDIVVGSAPMFPPLDEKVGFEVVATVVGSPANYAVGVVGRSHSLNAAFGTSTHGIGYYADGTIKGMALDGTTAILVTGLATYTSTDRIYVAVDNGSLLNRETYNGIPNTPCPDRKLIWFYKNGALVSAAGGIDIRQCEEQLFPAVQLYATGDKAVCHSTAAEIVTTQRSGHTAFGTVTQYNVTGTAGRYVTKDGGVVPKDGTSWEHAAAYAQLPGIIFDLNANVTGIGNPTVFIKADEDTAYTLSTTTLTNAGESSTNRTRIIGVSEDLIPHEAIFVGSRTAWVRPNDIEKYSLGTSSWGGSALFQLNAGANHYIFDHIRVERALGLIEFTGLTTDILIDRCGMFNVRRGINTKDLSTDTQGFETTFLTVKRTWSNGFSKPNIDARTYCHDWLIQDCNLNSGFQIQDGWAVAGKCEDSAHHVTWQRVWGYNCVDDTIHTAANKHYDEGDVFEDNNNNAFINYIDCFAYRAGDGGWDCKGRYNTFTGCYGKQLRKAFRTWVYEATYDDIHVIDPRYSHYTNNNTAPYTFGSGVMFSLSGTQGTTIANPSDRRRNCVCTVTNMHLYEDPANIGVGNLWYINGKWNYLIYDDPTCVWHQPAGVNVRFSSVYPPDGVSVNQGSGDTNIAVPGDLTITGPGANILFNGSTAASISIIGGTALRVNLTSSEPGFFDILDDTLVFPPNAEALGGPAGLGAAWLMGNDTFETNESATRFNPYIRWKDSINPAYDGTTPANNVKPVTVRFKSYNNVVTTKVFTVNVIASYAFSDTDAAALDARYTTAGAPLTDVQRAQLDTKIQALKSAGLWTKISIIQDARYGSNLFNWKGTTFTGSVVGSPTFSTANGVTLNGTTQYWDTAWNPATGGFGGLNDMWHAVKWGTLTSQSTLTHAGAYGTGAGSLSMKANTSGPNMSCRVNGTAAITVDGTGSSGLWIAGRTASNAQFFIRNGSGTVTGGATGVSTSIPSENYKLGIYNGAFCPVQARLFMAGSGMTQANAVTLNSIMNY